MANTVIFDMDGVIVDTEPLHRKAFFRHFEHLNLDLNEEMYTRFTGKSTRNVYQNICSHFGLDRNIEELVNEKREIFNGLFSTDKELDLLDGVGELIKELHENQVQLILASSSAKVTIGKIFERFNLYQYFSHIVSGEDFPESKPNPAIFNEANRLSGVGKEECVVIEDSTNGIRAANNAGIFCIGYKSFHSKNQDYSTADLVIGHFNEVDCDSIKTIRKRVLNDQ